MNVEWTTVVIPATVSIKLVGSGCSKTPFTGREVTTIELGRENSSGMDNFESRSCKICTQ